MYLVPWQIFAMGVVVGMFILIVIEIIFLVTHMGSPMIINEHEEEDKKNE